jgi:hypothetical protein
MVNRRFTFIVVHCRIIAVFLTAIFGPCGISAHKNHIKFTYLSWQFCLCVFQHTGKAVKRVCSSDVWSWSLFGVFFSVFTVRCLFLRRCERWTFSSAKNMAPLNHTCVGKSSTCNNMFCAYKILWKVILEFVSIFSEAKITIRLRVL